MSKGGAQKALSETRHRPDLAASLGKLDTCSKHKRFGLNFLRFGCRSLSNLSLMIWSNLYSGLF